MIHELNSMMQLDTQISVCWGEKCLLKWPTKNGRKKITISIFQFNLIDFDMEHETAS